MMRDFYHVGFEIRSCCDERTLRAKFAEALLALRLESAYDKNQLLVLYSANAPFGGTHAR